MASNPKASLIKADLQITIMNVETKLTSTWRNRMLFVGFMIVGVAAWFFYDGLVTWPDEAERYREYKTMSDSMVASGQAVNEEATEITLAWKKVAKEKGYPDKVPSERTDDDIAGQFKWGAGTGLVGLIFVAWVFWNQTLKIRSDEQFVYSARGKKVAWGDFTKVDRTKWEKKGIAVAHFTENGKDGKIVLDDYKFAPAEDIILEIERRLGVTYVSPADREAAEGEDSSTEDSDEAAETIDNDKV